ncbi:hypothetical protein PI125_g11873 [Phytophthora idaei]|nr:hypothetical protein PI125_g11873 [Phytophthora idaei]
MTDQIAAGSLAFVGPMHVGALTEFQYVRVTSMDEHLIESLLLTPTLQTRNLARKSSWGN